jgi:C4-dicarboxylate transporter, DctM subunit
MITILAITAIVLLALGVPVAFSLLIGSLFAVAFDGAFPLLVVIKEMFTGLDSFPLMAVPFFILAAELMTGGALTDVLLRFASQFVAHLRGGLGYTNIFGLTLFSGISGSALADAAGPGSVMIRMMEQTGYRRSYAGALTASIAVVGPIIPPSIIMVLYALQDERVSVGALFAAGFVPGFLIAGAMCAVHWVHARGRKVGDDGRRTGWREGLSTTAKALPALALIVLILGGMRAGLFTPTEASVVAVFYAWFCGTFVYRTLHLAQIPGILVRSALLTVSVLTVIAASAAFAWILTVQAVPQQLSAWIIGQEMSAWSFLIAVNVLLLLFGIFIEPTPGVVVLVPILAPAAAALGIDPIHFAMVVIINLTLGMLTPPVGGLLFVVSATARIPISELSRRVLPFVAAHLVVLGLITAIPTLSTGLPRWLGM